MVNKTTLHVSIYAVIASLLLLVFSFVFRTNGQVNLKKLLQSGKLSSLDTLKFNQDPALISLGKILFHDKRFSKNQNVSCASCHIEEKGFGNGLPFSEGTHGAITGRHVPHLLNVGFQEHFFWDGRAATLEDQLKAVIESKDELDMTFEEVIKRISNDSAMIKKFNSNFENGGINKKNITKAIVAYEKSILSSFSRYDQFLKGDTTALNSTEIAGLNLFAGKANCIACHNGPNLSDGKFHNVGVITEDKGRHLIEKIGMANEFESRPYPFFSNFKAFKTPTLRNITKTGPYFHNGSKNTLRDILLFYNIGGENPDKTGLAKEIKPLHLNDLELNQLEAFLKSL